MFIANQDWRKDFHRPQTRKTEENFFWRGFGDVNTAHMYRNSVCGAGLKVQDCSGQLWFFGELVCLLHTLLRVSGGYVVLVSFIKGLE